MTVNTMPAQLPITIEEIPRSTWQDGAIAPGLGSPTAVTFAPTLSEHEWRQRLRSEYSMILVVTSLGLTELVEQIAGNP